MAPPRAPEALESFASILRLTARTLARRLLPQADGLWVPLLTTTSLVLAAYDLVVPDHLSKLQFINYLRALADKLERDASGDTQLAVNPVMTLTSPEPDHGRIPR